MQSDQPIKREEEIAGQTDERTDAAFSILKELRKVQEKSDKAGLNFLSYLIQMAILEAQAIASGEKTGSASEKRPGGGDAAQ